MADSSRVFVIRTFDDEREANVFADREHSMGRKVGVSRTLEWNRVYPDKLVLTVNRWLVFGER